jgi:hypothetical protein
MDGFGREHKATVLAEMCVNIASEENEVGKTSWQSTTHSGCYDFQERRPWSLTATVQPFADPPLE